MDQPFNGLAMITAFTRGQSLIGMDKLVPLVLKDSGTTAGSELLLEHLAGSELPQTASGVTWQELHDGERASAKGSLPRDLNLRSEAQV